MILHFITDNNFTDYAIRQFSDEEMRSRFVMVSNFEDIKYTALLSDVEIVKSHSSRFTEILGQLGEYNAVILHGLFWPWMERIFNAIPTDVKLCWVFWGGEIYGRNDLIYNFLAPHTRRLLHWQTTKRFVKNHFSSSLCYNLPISLFKRIDYCLTDVHEDFVFVRNYINPTMKELWYNYYSVEDTIGGLMDSVCNGNNILVDNSCSIGGNHMEAFQKVRRMPIAGRSVIVPLSYGETWLRKRLLKRGKRCFGDSFHPLVDFLPRDEYNKLILSCSIVVMNHYRPQAFGNILTALWLGSRVYMSKSSLLYAFFKRVGCILFCVEDDLKPNNQQALLSLSEYERKHNRAVICSLYSREVMYQRNMEIVREIDGA